MRASSTVLLLVISGSITPNFAAPFVGVADEGLQLRDLDDLFERAYFAGDLATRNDEILNLVARDLAERGDVNELEAREFIDDLVTRATAPGGQAESGAINFLAIGRTILNVGKSIGKGIGNLIKAGKARKAAKAAQKAQQVAQQAKQQQPAAQAAQAAQIKKTRDLDGLYERDDLSDVLSAREDYGNAFVARREDDLDMRSLNELD